MITRLLILSGLLFLLFFKSKAQYIYYKNPDSQVITLFNDTAHRVFLKKMDSNDVLLKQFNYVLKFYPKMLVKDIIVEFKKSPTIARTRPKFSSIFKMPERRVYKIYFSNGTNSTLDRVTIDNLTFNSQIGLIAHQVSMIEDMSTGGFFNFVAFYFKQLSRKGRRRVYLDAEEKTLEVGLGYQLLSFNRESEENLKIDNWSETKGYANYLYHYKNRPMKPQNVIHFINDLPVYVANPYK